MAKNHSLLEKKLEIAYSSILKRDIINQTYTIESAHSGKSFMLSSDRLSVLSISWHNDTALYFNSFKRNTELISLLANTKDNDFAVVYIEQANADEAESLVLTYWNKEEFAQRVRRLCQLAEVDGFDITNDGERDQAREAIKQIMAGNADSAKTERDEYLEILIDCVDTYSNHKDLYKSGPPAPLSLPLEGDALIHLREDGYKGHNKKRQIRLVRSATFRIHPRPDQSNLLMNGYLRIVDVPGLGAGMKLHEAITLEEMKREDAMIVLVTDAGRQRVDEMKSLQAVNWVKENRLFGLSGRDLDEAAAKIFLVINGGNVRQAFDRLNAGLPESELEVKEVTRYIAPNYWDRYKDRGHNRPYFLVMAPPALYVQDPEHSPKEFSSETERIAKVFADQLGQVDIKDPLCSDSRPSVAWSSWL